MTTGELLVELLRRHGVDTLFGIPGNHTIALYRSLAEHGIRHVTCRHEQGAAFMADGYARASGRPGVCTLISGPGLMNAATAIAQAAAESVPMLVVSGVAPVRELGMGHRTLHELPDQRAAARAIGCHSHTLLDPANLPELIDRAFARFTTTRPGPVHIEIPLDLMDAPVADSPVAAPVDLGPPGPDPARIRAAAALLDAASRPLILAGGGAVGAASELTALAEQLDAPLVNTVNAKGVLPAGHPLAVGGSPSLPCLRAALADADALLAIGTELGETDYDLLMSGPLEPHGGLIRVDIHPDALLTPVPGVIGIVSDARLAASALLDATQRLDRSGPERAAALRAAVRREPHYHPDLGAFFAALRDAAPEARIVGDSTRPTYYAAWQLECDAPRRYFHSASGFGTLGFALPAAFGAALADPRPVICLIGDGGIQFTLPELETGAEAGLPVPVLVWHNDGYREIENSMRARGIPTDSTRVRAPDFRAAATAHHVRYARPHDLKTLGAALRDALGADRPTLIELREADFVSAPSGQWYR